MEREIYSARKNKKENERKRMNEKGNYHCNSNHYCNNYIEQRHKPLYKKQFFLYIKNKLQLTLKN